MLVFCHRNPEGLTKTIRVRRVPDSCRQPRKSHSGMIHQLVEFNWWMFLVFVVGSSPTSCGMQNHSAGVHMRNVPLSICVLMIFLWYQRASPGDVVNMCQ